jgi:single-stranded-DNA-specific exonuclease
VDAELSESTLIEAPALDITSSVGGRRWVWRLGDARLGAGLAQAAGISELTGRLLAARGIDADGVRDFLAPTVRAAMPDPDTLTDMPRAAERIARAVLANELVAVFGDYDVDGAASAALLCRFIRDAGGKAIPYIPDRLTEGYGPNETALAALVGQGASLVVCVDCGTAGGEALASIAGSADVIVLDHHAVDALPETPLAVVNPNRPDDTSGLRHLCAAGVALMAAVAANRVLRRAGHYATRAEPDLMGLLDLVALATVCDVVPLVGLNRAFVAQGLRVLQSRARPGLAALADAAQLKAPPDAWTLGFVFGPRINAGGRVGDAGMGARLLLEDDALAARALAESLDATNRHRREVEAGVLEAAIAEGEAQAASGRAVILVAGQGWHAGVIGIVAGRLRERLNRPAIAVALDDAGEGRGSGRGVPGLDLGAAVIAARQSGLLLRAGGHAMAAGFSVAPGFLPQLHDFLEARLAAAAMLPAAEDLAIDGALSVDAATLGFAEEVGRLAPFGAANPEPVFVLRHARVARAERMGVDGAHVRAFLAGEAGGRLRAVAFRCAEARLGQALLAAQGRTLHLAGQLRAAEWQGEARVTLHMVDAASA